MSEAGDSPITNQRNLKAGVFGVLGIYWLALVHQLGAQWSVFDQYNYGWAVPFLCLYLFWNRIQTPEARPRSVPSSILYLLLAACALFYLPTRWLHEANPIWRLTSLLWAGEVIVITLCVVRIAAQARQLSQSVSDFIFPACFFLVAVPWPSGVESFLIQWLTRWNVSATVEVLGWLNIPALHHGNVIEVSSGSVGVDEACSGIRSFQATLMIALFFGDLFRLRLVRRGVCVLVGFALAFLFNVGRTTLLSFVAAKQGTPAVATWHDPASITILVGCFLSLWLIAVLLKSKVNTGEGLMQKSEPQTDSTGALNNSGGAKLKWLALALLGWFLLVEAGTELWFRQHENFHSTQEQWSVHLSKANPTVEEQAIPQNILSQFRSDESLNARWRDAGGNAWQLYYFRWQPAHALARRVASQLAKTHGPEMCLPAIGMVLKADLGTISVTIGEFKLTLQQFEFLAGSQPLHVFYGIYEDSTGGSTLANRRQSNASRVAAAWSGSRNSGQRFLELAVSGVDDPAKAQAALQRELEHLIVTQPTPLSSR